MRNSRNILTGSNKILVYIKKNCKLKIVYIKNFSETAKDCFIGVWHYSAIRDIGVTTATLGFDPKRRGLTPLYPSNFKIHKIKFIKNDQINKLFRLSFCT